MDDLIINNTSVVLENASIIMENSIKMASITESIDYILHQVIDKYWSENQDQLSFKNGLNTNMVNLNEIIKYNKLFSQYIQDYIEMIKQEGSETV